MKDLNFDLKNMCLRMPQGSYATRQARHRSLQLIGDQLADMGYRLPSARSLKPKHIHKLVERWKAEGLSVGTLKNRLGHMRWWAEAVGKKSILETNDAYGVGQREGFQGNRAQRLDYDKLGTIGDAHVRMALKLQAAFGLRREEAIKFRPSLADRGDRIALKASWTKGGRYREIPITHDRQRELLDEACQLAGDGSLIPNDKRYIDQLKTYENATLKAGLKNNHGLRHGYAQWRYKSLTGWNCPAAGGPKAKEMTPEQRAIDFDARMEISEELGHGRIDVTNTYLGGRS